jgi:putative nucleotidyltransferase with HDIG domain
MDWTPFDVDDRAALNAAIPTPEDSPVVIVDDEVQVLDLLSKVLGREGYPVDVFESGQSALPRIREGGVSLLITDIRMPDMDGMELASLALEEDPDLAILVLTGAAEDYLQKPVPVDELLEAVRRALRRRSHALYRHQLEAWLRAEVNKRTEQVQLQAEQLQEVSLATLTALIRAMEAKDPYLRGHSERVAELGVRMAIELAMDSADVEEIRVACLLHDIGMIAIRESVMHKNGPLTDDEYRHIQGHVKTGASILRPLPNLGGAVDFVQYHHERLDGSGYPEGLSGEQIPFGAQIVGAAEIFVSLTESRAHREARSASEALEAMKRGCSAWYLPDVMGALDSVISTSQ